MKPPFRLQNVAFLLALGIASGCADLDMDDPSVDDVEQDFVVSASGLSTINGLTSTSGLASANGLTSTNGLSTVGGIATASGLPASTANALNGLATAGGAPTAGGLPVDCTGGKIPGITCTGAPDGLLSSTSGLMKDSAGIELARYAVRCALKATDAADRLRRQRDHVASGSASVSLQGSDLGNVAGSVWRDYGSSNSTPSIIS